MPCAFVDGGANYAGALYDATRILNAQHRVATPRYARGPVRRYEIAAVGLTPYGHLPDAHFYASTAPWVLQLVHLLPPTVPILVALSSRLRELYAHLGVDAERLHELPPNGAAYADRLLSLVTTPFGALEPLGAAALRRVRTRFVPVPAPPEQRTRLIYLSRRSISPRRNLRNEIELLAALRHTLQLQPAPAVHTLEVFDGASGQRLLQDRRVAHRSEAPAGRDARRKGKRLRDSPPAGLQDLVRKALRVVRGAITQDVVVARGAFRDARYLLRERGLEPA
jgi:hypothetical protein